MTKTTKLCVRPTNSDLPGHPCSLISLGSAHLSRQGPNVSSCGAECADTQADLRLNWAQMRT